MCCRLHIIQRNAWVIECARDDQYANLNENYDGMDSWNGLLEWITLMILLCGPIVLSWRHKCLAVEKKDRSIFFFLVRLQCILQAFNRYT